MLPSGCAGPYFQNVTSERYARIACFVSKGHQLSDQKGFCLYPFRSVRCPVGFNPRPEWFDHYLDQHWQWSAKNNSLWVERGVFSGLVMKPNAQMLEICCGDGFNARHFYWSRAASIVALDFDKDAIPHARRYNSAPNISHVQQDIREGLPAGPFDIIVWELR